MKNKYIMLGIGLLIGISIGLMLGQSNAFFGFFEYPPSDSQSKFVEACAELNGKELKIENIKKLGGRCHSGSLQACTSENITKLKDDIDPFFVIYHKKDKDNTWSCRVDNDGNKIKAVPYYQYE